MPIFSYIRKWLQGAFQSRTYQDIEPDEIFLDAQNRPGFDRHQLEGRLESRIKRYTVYTVGALFALMFIGYLLQIGVLQIHRGSAYAKESRQNALASRPIIAPRGQIVDTDGKRLAWNEDVDSQQFPARMYATTTGISHVLGYVKPPQQDAKGNYYSQKFTGRGGVESAFEGYLQGKNGRMIIEENALGERVAASTVKQPTSGKRLQLTIDTGLQSKLYELMKQTAEKYDYRGGAAVLMDVQTGRLRSLVSFPEYSSQKLTRGTDADYIQQVLNSSSTPFLNRASEGLYTPGSIVKPFVALSALNEDVIDPREELLSTKELRVQNPYDPDSYTVFEDWKAHGEVDMREALAVSSNVYFYKIGGGHEQVDGAGIDAIEEYMRAFELNGPTGTIGLPERAGNIPSPAWKRQVFDGAQWRLGDTYNTAIGQYGFQITPLAAARSVAGIAREGRLPTPTIAAHKHGDATQVQKDIPQRFYNVVKEGMRKAVTDGTADALDLSYLDIAAKTGTAEVSGKTKINSWIIGFYPYDDPEYAFATVMEHGPKDNTVGGLYVMRQLFDWMQRTDSKYLQ